MLTLNHKKLDVWQLAIKFVPKIYKITSSYPRDELFGLVSQTRRASISISANIAEGSSRKSLVERKRFYEISRSSLVEVDNHLVIAIELGMLSNSDISEIELDINELFAKLSKFIEKAK
jgi:four helix bundle protein